MGFQRCEKGKCRHYVVLTLLRVAGGGEELRVLAHVQWHRAPHHLRRHVLLVKHGLEVQHACLHPHKQRTTNIAVGSVTRAWKPEDSSVAHTHP